MFSLSNCIEDILGYKAPAREKPYTAYKETLKWADYNAIPESWRNIIETALDIKKIEKAKEAA